MMGMKRKSPSQQRATEKWLAKQKLDRRCEIAVAKDIIKRQRKPNDKER
jgi:hypothetical protein